MKAKIGSITLEGMKRIYAFVKNAETKDIKKAYTSPEQIVKSSEIVELDITTELPVLRFSQNEGEHKKDDEINTITLHQSLAELTPSEAASRGIWVWFTHVHYWDYMRTRWPLTEISERVSIENHVITHFLIKGQNTRSFIRNGIARLWWYGYLSEHDGDYTNTSVLLSQLDIASTLLERSQGRNKIIRNIFFKKLLRHKDVFLEVGNEARLRVRALAKKINFFGSIRLIDALSLHELEAETDKMIEEVLIENP